MITYYSKYYNTKIYKKHDIILIERRIYMPSFVTHNIYARETKELLNKDVQKIINTNLNLYLMASQSFDLFKYCLINHKELKKLCQKCHRINVNKYFINLLEEVKNNPNPELEIFIYGSITHAILDQNLHPYIVYKTGIYNGKPETLKYDGLHTLLETQYDIFNYERYYKHSIIKENLKINFFEKLTINKNTIASINKVFNDMYQVNGGTELLNGYKCARNNINIIRKENILNKIYYSFNKNLRTYLFNRNNTKYDFLNIEHKKWYYPSDNTISKNDSIIDLYNESLELGKKAINACYEYIHNNNSIDDFLEIIGNKGYIRGTDCNELKPIKYFEF